jgi:HD superfamily phosphohydrolase
VIPPKTQVPINIKWHYIINKGSHSRTGGVDSTTFFIAYFFPHIAVYDDIDGWDDFHFKGDAEFYNDFGDFDVNAYTLDANHILFPPSYEHLFGTDRLDYLCRDSYHIGSKYGVIEHDTIIRSIVIENDKIYFNEKYAHSLEYMLLARHYMFYAVYQHKTVRKLNCMLIEAIENVLNHFSPHELYYMDDLDLIYYFKEYEIKEWHDIETRKLWKTIGAYDSLEDIPEKYLDSSEYCIDEPLDWKPKIHTYLYPSKEKFKSKILSYLNKIYRGKYYVFKKND